MKMLKVSQCKKTLNFKPQLIWPPHLPAFAWGDELLCDFDADSEKMAIDLKAPDKALALVLNDIYKNLSLAELARIFSIFDFEKADFELLLEKNSLRASEVLIELFLKLAQTPLEFQIWTTERKLGAKELFVIKALENINVLDRLFLNIASLCPSRQVGIQILENAIELFLMSHPLETVLSRENESLDIWCTRLEKMRNPMLTLRTEEKQFALAELPWPKFIQTRVIQNQASLVNEVRLQYRNLGEFKRNIEALQRVQAEMENQYSGAKLQ